MPELGPESLTFTDKLVIYEIARGTFTAPSLLLQAMGITEELSARIRENWRVFFEPDEAYFIGDYLNGTVFTEKCLGLNIRRKYRPSNTIMQRTSSFLQMP